MGMAQYYSHTYIQLTQIKSAINSYLTYKIY